MPYLHPCLPYSHTRFLMFSRKPLVCFFPTLFKQNLLTFISLVHQLLPRTAVQDLLVCPSQDPDRGPWVSALMRQLERAIGVHSEGPLCTPACCQRLKQLSLRFVGPGGARGWAHCFGGHLKDSGNCSPSPEQETQKKRKSSQISLDSDGEDTEQQSKRPKVDACRMECIDAAEQSVKGELSESLVASEGTDKNIHPATDSGSQYSFLPQHIKVTTDGLICSVYSEASQFLFPQFTYSMLCFSLNLYLDDCSYNRFSYW